MVEPLRLFIFVEQRPELTFGFVIFRLLEELHGVRYPADMRIRIKLLPSHQDLRREGQSETGKKSVFVPPKKHGGLSNAARRRRLVRNPNRGKRWPGGRGAGSDRQDGSGTCGAAPDARRPAPG